MKVGAGETTKTCTKCGDTMALDEFYTGHAKCKRCYLDKQKERYRSSERVRDAKKESAINRYHKMRNDEFFKRQRADAVARYRERHPDRIAADAERDKEKTADRHKRRAENLEYGYVRNFFRGVDVTDDLIALKRAQLQIYRLTKKLKQEIKNV